MENKSPFCTCNSLDCPHHPINHGNGCTPCIVKNLKNGEIPGCFFKKAADGYKGDTYSFEDFAQFVLKNK